MLAMRNKPLVGIKRGGFTKGRTKMHWGLVRTIIVLPGAVMVFIPGAIDLFTPYHLSSLRPELRPRGASPSRASGP